MPHEFVELVETYNACVGAAYRQGVRLRIVLDHNKTVREHLEDGRFWDVLPLTEHSVKLIKAIACVAEPADWTDRNGPLFVSFDIGAHAPTFVFLTTKDPSQAHVVGEYAPMRVRVPLYVWLLMRLQDAPGMNEYPVVAHTPEGMEVQRHELGPMNRVHVHECLCMLRNSGII